MKITSPSILQNEEQILIVHASGTRAKVYMCNKVDNKWITIMETEGFIGKKRTWKRKRRRFKNTCRIV